MALWWMTNDENGCIGSSPCLHYIYLLHFLLCTGWSLCVSWTNFYFNQCIYAPCLVLVEHYVGSNTNNVSTPPIAVYSRMLPQSHCDKEDGRIGLPSWFHLRYVLRSLLCACWALCVSWTKFCFNQCIYTSCLVFLSTVLGENWENYPIRREFRNQSLLWYLQIHISTKIRKSQKIVQSQKPQVRYWAI